MFAMQDQYKTNVCRTVPEKPADVISEVLNSKNFLHFTQIVKCLSGVCL